MITFCSRILTENILHLKDCIEENKKPEVTEKMKRQRSRRDERRLPMMKKEPEKTTIFYVTDEIQQSQYINMFREAGKDAVILKHNIDSAVYYSSGAERSDMYSLRELMQTFLKK